MIPPFPYLGNWFDGLIRSLGDIQGQTQTALDTFSSAAPTLAASVTDVGGVLSGFIDGIPLMKILIMVGMGVVILKVIIGR